MRNLYVEHPSLLEDFIPFISAKYQEKYRRLLLYGEEPEKETSTDDAVAASADKLVEEKIEQSDTTADTPGLESPLSLSCLI